MSALLLILSLLVSIDVFWFLRQPGLTLAGDASCGILEHSHNHDCGTQVCICSLPEEPHVHSGSCYETQLIEILKEPQLVCRQTETPHVHSDACYKTILTESTRETILVCSNEDETHLHEDLCYETVLTGGQAETILNCEIVFDPHEHGESCYETEAAELTESQVLICDRSEEAHVHNDTCYVWEFTCEYEAHTHSITCYSDEHADVENNLTWQEMFEDYPYTGNLREDLVNIAKTQVGYSESTLNFQVGNAGIRRGYTRYGAWYGTPYSDWSATFVSFCLHYAGADPEEAPGNTGANSMAELWLKQERYIPAGEYLPTEGDLVFFENNTMGIVSDVQHDTFQFIGGDIDNAVSSQMILLSQEEIAGWGITEGLHSLKKGPDETEPPIETEVPETTTAQEQLNDPESSASEAENNALLDITNGPAVFIFHGSDARLNMQRFSFRSSRSITELLPYLEANGGNYFFTLLDMNNQELPKDDAGNYIAQANTGYKLTISVTSPEGFLPGSYQYQIPNGLMVDGGEGSFILKDGTNVGTWVVTDTGLITLNFNENMNSRTDITISATMGIHFPEQDEPIDFDGKITITVEPPPQQKDPTVLQKWGQPNANAGKLDWFVQITGHTDSQIPGSILTDQVGLPDWGKPHSYTQSDMDAGLTFGVSDPNGGWHNWTVTTDDPHLIWTETGWSYKIPHVVTCDYCGELELGNDGWSYQVSYSSTPTPLNTPGEFSYENTVTVDGQTAWGWNYFVHGQTTAEIIKNGTFVSDAAGGGFLWTIHATVPGRPEGQRAEYSWAISDEMRLLDQNGVTIERLPNDINLAIVTATYNGTTIQIPRIQDATDQDMFAWDNAWTSEGIPATRTINLLCRCQCTPETCHWTGCGEYWFQRDDGSWAANGFCQCWTETQNMTFTLTYKTSNLAILEAYGSLGYQVNNNAQLYYLDDNNNTVPVDNDDASVAIPNLFEKQLTHDFDGYTANYRVTVNEAKLVLTNGSPLTIHDVMTNTLAYISGSLVITAEDADGNTTELKQGTDYTVHYDGTGNQTDASGKEVHVLDIVILRPQPVMYILDYDATLIIPEHVTGGIKYSNSATISLWGEDFSDTSAEKVHADINIAAKSYSLEMHKTCATTGEPLPGATFGLFNEHGGQIASAVTDANGTLLFKTNIIEGIILREHIPYYLQELKAPPGYQLDNRKYWFCFCDSKADYCKTCQEITAGLDAFRIPFEQIGKVDVTNELLNYNLPATGGSGIYPVILVSVIFIITPLVYEFIRRRKQERRGVR